MTPETFQQAVAIVFFVVAFLVSLDARNQRRLQHIESIKLARREDDLSREWVSFREAIRSAENGLRVAIGMQDKLNALRKASDILNGKKDGP